MAITKPGRAAGTIPESGERKIAVPAPDGSSNIEIPEVAETEEPQLTCHRQLGSSGPSERR
jgi:hypothetical protein